eukprot:620799-Rhodomonas_salina.1
MSGSDTGRAAARRRARGPCHAERRRLAPLRHVRGRASSRQGSQPSPRRAARAAPVRAGTVAAAAAGWACSSP